MEDYLRKRRRVFLIVMPAFLGALYMILCAVNLQQSIWFDESFSSYLTRFDLKSIWEFTAADVNPPFYYFLLKAWAHVFGHTDFAMRMMSTILGAIAIMFAFLWLKYKYGLKAASISGFLLSISPIFIRYGQEMRMYTLVVAIVFAATFFLQLAIDNGRKCWWIIYAILVALGMWTHYFAALAWCAHLLYLIKIYGKKFWTEKIWLVYVLSILLFLPWVPSLFAQVTDVEQNGFWVSPVSVSTIASYFTEGIYYMRADEVKNWLMILAVITFFVISFLLIHYRKRMTLLLLVALVPLVLLMLLSMPPLDPLFISRYIMFAMLATPMATGVGVTLLMGDINKKARRSKKNRPAWRPALTAICLALLLVGSSAIGVATVYQKGNYNMDTGMKTVSKNIFNSVVGLDAGKNLPIISNSAWLYYDLVAYTSEEHPVLFINEKTSYKYGSMKPLEKSYFGRIDDLDGWLAKHDSFWYVGKAPTKEGQDYIKFPREGWRVAEVMNQQYDEHSYTYQILKLERE